MNLRNKIPRWEAIVPVYAVIVMALYAWSLLHFFWRFSSWLNFLSLGELAVMYSYTAAVNFIESALLLLVLLLLCLLLPSKWFFDEFAVKGSLFTLLGLGLLMFFHKTLIADLRLAFAATVLSFILAVLLSQIRFVRKAVDGFANGMIVFLYLWMPISAIAILAVLLRNIF